MNQICTSWYQLEKTSKKGSCTSWYQLEKTSKKGSCESFKEANITSEINVHVFYYYNNYCYAKIMVILLY